MATIHNYEIYTEDGVQPPVMIALADLRKQRWPALLGKRLRVMTKVITAQIEEIGDERKRLLEVHARKGADGEPVEVKTWADLADITAFRTDFQEFLEDTFTIAGLPFNDMEGKELMGETWASPLLEEELPKPDEKKEEAGAGDGGSSAPPASSGATEPADN